MATEKTAEVTTTYVVTLQTLKRIPRGRVVSAEIYAKTLPVWHRIILRPLWCWPMRLLMRRLFCNPWVLFSVTVRKAPKKIQES